MKGTHLFFDRKHKHMLQKTEPQLDKSGVLYLVIHKEFHVLNRRIDVSGLSHFGSWYFNFFRHGKDPFKVTDYADIQTKLLKAF